MKQMIENLLQQFFASKLRMSGFLFPLLNVWPINKFITNHLKNTISTTIAFEFDEHQLTKLSSMVY